MQEACIVVAVRSVYSIEIGFGPDRKRSFKSNRSVLEGKNVLHTELGTYSTVNTAVCLAAISCSSVNKPKNQLSCDDVSSARP